MAFLSIYKGTVDMNEDERMPFLSIFKGTVDMN